VCKQKNVAKQKEKYIKTNKTIKQEQKTNKNCKKIKKFEIEKKYTKLQVMLFLKKNLE